LQYLAHFDKDKNEKQPLNEHLFSVANLAKNHIPPTVTFGKIKNSIIKEVCYWMGYFHDLGKYSNYFQDYLQKGINSRLKNHAHISACFTYSYISRVLSKFDDHKLLLFLVYMCIRLHHTSLKRNDLFKDEMWEELILIGKHLSKKANDILTDLDLTNKISYEEFCSLIDVQEFKSNACYLEYIPLMFNNGRIHDSKWYFLLIYLFSILIDTDKLDSANLSSFQVSRVPPENVTKYLCKKHGTEYKIDLATKREKARRTILGVIDSLSDNEVKNTRFFTLTAPTGIGKTLSSLQCALRLQERIAEVEKYTPRIITAIPFINIIEQNKSEYENVLRGKCKLVVHHRLSDFGTKKFYDETTPLDKILLETESWEADVVLTTFVQLFQSMFTGENRLLKKINKLAGSIVILDEAQAIPEKYMPLIGATLYKFAEYYGTRFILMTATQPKLLEFGQRLLSKAGEDLYIIKSVELLPDYEEYFKFLDRTKFVPLLEKVLDAEGFIKLFFNKWSCDKSALIVLNTIKRSIQIYNEIKKQVKDKEFNVPVYYLSTNIIPLKRKAVIKEVKDLLEKRKPVILVSTQTIEAGVDLDFDMAFRDFAPLDSLIQTAGRVNREGKKGNYLPVYIVQLENDNHYVYDLSLRETTMNLLKSLLNEEEIKETNYSDLVKRYYSLALERGVDDESLIIWKEGICKIDFEILKRFKLIKSIGEVCDVFIEKDSKATDLADAYQHVLGYKDSFDYDLSKIFPNINANLFGKKLDVFQRKALLRLIMAKLSDYIVQVRVSRLKENIPIEFKARGNIESNLYWVPPGQLNDYYCEETGFIDKSGNAFI